MTIGSMTGAAAEVATAVDRPEVLPEATDNRPRPEDGEQDVDQQPHLEER